MASIRQTSQGSAARAFALAWIFDQALAIQLAPRFGVLLLLLGVFALLELRAPAPEGRGVVGLGNPVELGQAGVLALLLTVLLVGGHAAQAAFGTAGLWATGAVAELGFPVLQALSRKDFVGETLDLPVDQRLYGTLASTAIAAWLGTTVFRAHDVAATVQVAAMVASIRGDRPPTVAVRGEP